MYINRIQSNFKHHQHFQILKKTFQIINRKNIDYDLANTMLNHIASNT